MKERKNGCKKERKNGVRKKERKTIKQYSTSPRKNEKTENVEVTRKERW